MTGATPAGLLVAKRFLLVAALAATGVLVDATAAWPEVASCSSEDEGSPGIALLAPFPDDEVSGTSVVTGTARSRSLLSRVELVIEDEVVDSQSFPDSMQLDFTLRWDAGRYPAGLTFLTVRACGAVGHAEHVVGVRVEPRRPLWAGIVMGLAGVGGLAYACAFRRGTLQDGTSSRSS